MAASVKVIVFIAIMRFKKVINKGWVLSGKEICALNLHADLYYSWCLSDEGWGLFTLFTCPVRLLSIHTLWQQWTWGPTALSFVRFDSSLTLACGVPYYVCMERSLNEVCKQQAQGTEMKIVISHHCRIHRKKGWEKKYLFCFDNWVSRLRPVCECLRIAAVKMFRKKMSWMQT